MRLAVVTPAPAPTGGGDTARLLAELARGAEVSLFVEPAFAGAGLAGLEARAIDALRPREFDQVLFLVRNEAGCGFMPRWIRAIGGVVALHEWVLFDLALAACPELGRTGWRGLATAAREGGLAQARLWRSCRGAREALERERFRLSLHRSVVRFADAFVVHSAHLAERVREDRNAPTPIGLVRPGVEPAWSDEPRARERERLGLPAAWRAGFLVTSPGALGAHARTDVLLDAVARARRSRPGLVLALVGGEGARDLGEHVHATGPLSRDDELRWLRAGDLGVHLRGPSTGRLSGALVRTLAAGRGAIASRLPEYQELPAECVHKLHPAEDEAARLAQKLVELADAPSVRAAMEQAARDFIERECRWETVGARWLELLERFPRPRSARRSLLALRLEERAREGYARGRTGRSEPRP
jgi:glycosyltransferase involved in cell wall biosynthesis